VKNRNKLTTEHAELTEEAQFNAQKATALPHASFQPSDAPQNLLTPQVLSKKPPTPLNSLSQ
jgi:hypothetical protein